MRRFTLYFVVACYTFLVGYFTYSIPEYYYAVLPSALCVYILVERMMQIDFNLHRIKVILIVAVLWIVTVAAFLAFVVPMSGIGSGLSHCEPDLSELEPAK